jgi:hypothetical protein
LVDLVILQSVSYLAAAISVILYVTNLFISNRREERNRRIAFTTNMLATVRSKESYLDMMDMLNWTWSARARSCKKAEYLELTPEMIESTSLSGGTYGNPVSFSSKNFSVKSNPFHRHQSL